MVSEERIALLEKTIRYLLGEPVSYYPAQGDRPERFYDTGCGCCSSTVTPPEEIAAVIREFV
jgi:hypothetical protein